MSSLTSQEQGCINCGILVSGIRARGVSSEHMENMEMFSRDGSKNFNIRTCEHMILGQLRMGARQAKNAPL